MSDKNAAHGSNLCLAIGRLQAALDSIIFLDDLIARVHHAEFTSEDDEPFVREGMKLAIDTVKEHIELAVSKLLELHHAEKVDEILNLELESVLDGDLTNENFPLPH